jgi:septum site-determining protein MinC
MIGENHFKVQIKGVREGLLITLGEGEWPVLQQELMQHITDQSSFFQGARVALDVGSHIFHAAEMGSLRDKLADKGVSLWAILSNSPTTEQTAQMLGLATRLSAPRPERVIHKLDTDFTGDNTVFVQKTLRSGFKISYAGHVIVVGDVNPGAEIIAEGSVIIWGRLRGSVHAGSDGNEQVVVCALEMTPMRLRIAKVVASFTQRQGKHLPEIAHIKAGQVISDIWTTRDGGK